MMWNEYIKTKLRPFKKELVWKYKYQSLRSPKVKGKVPHNDNGIQEDLIEKLKDENFSIQEYQIDTQDYEQYIANAKYDRYPKYYGGGIGDNFKEKSLEHYLAAQLLDLSEDDIYIDIANSGSPTPEIYRELYGCEVYRQDLFFPEGLNGNVIGGDASDLPVEDGFVTKMALHCSFEHFEKNSDISFIKETSRVLKKGGRVCILPLYLFSRYSIETNPYFQPRGGIPFESDAKLFCVNDKNSVHCRYYDVPHLVDRIKKNLGDLRLTIHVVKNEMEIDPTCYIKFAAVFEKQ